ncbi:MAG: threonine synthase [Ruminococcaceae bacterium]|nr:threonine synthase [Oscillospiraceae bacterium]
MYYTSTRDSSVKVTAAQAITNGISKEGGLYVPCEIPSISRDFIKELSELDYIGRAKKILSLYLTDFSEEELDYCVGGAYAAGKFSAKEVAPTVTLENGVSILELWHGPTCAFKDMALQLLPYLLTTSAKKTADGKQIVILVATSGDTGKAALEGFKDVENTNVLVFYPNDGVSAMQKLQMCTQEGDNVAVCAIKGNFDDAQTSVKEIFTSDALKAKLAENNMMFSSANSINWGRLVPQIVYYFSTYCDLLNQGKIELGDKINIVVPTGNFGNILAAYYAREMGVPIKKLICASNANNVLTEFIESGFYNKDRDFYTTISPSMDILVSSNLERLLYHLSGDNDAFVNDCMEGLFEDGNYTVNKAVYEKIRGIFEGGFCDDDATKATIGDIYKRFNYLCDTHTAVAVTVYYNYLRKTADNTPAVIASTASPYKFCPAVLEAVASQKDSGEDGFALMQQLNTITDVPIPAPLAAIKNKPVRFDKVVERSDMTDVVLDMLGI